MNTQIIINSLVNRSIKKNPIKIGMIGYGFMGKAIVDQLLKWNKSISIKKIYCRNIEKCIGLTRYGISVTQSILDLAEDKDIELIIDCTGSVQFAFDSSLLCIKNRKHVLSMNCELQSTFGHILYEKAKEYGVIYSDCDGDQPGVLSDLFSHVESIGFRPLVIGTCKGYLNRYASKSDLVKYKQDTGQSDNILVSATDGTKMNLEQSVIGNFVGGVVDMHGMPGKQLDKNQPLSDCLSLYNYDELKNQSSPMIDYIIHPNDPSVYIIADTNTKLDSFYMDIYKMGTGPMYLFYQPYHLCHYDIISSIVKICDFGSCIVASRYKNITVVSRAKKNLYAGEILDGIGGDMLYGSSMPVHSVTASMLPIGLSYGCKLQENIVKDQIIRYKNISVNFDLE